MLSFDTDLSNSLKNANTTAFWVIKLYYNDESNFIGLSDIDRPDGSDMYFGLISSWGNLSQSCSFFDFNTSTGNMSIRIINTERSIQGGRFSDLFATNNFGNRKWELFLNTNQTSTLDTSTRMIGTGVISGDIKYDYDSLTLTLLDIGAKKHKVVPVSTVDSSTYPNAPEKNLNKPIPMSYGDFYEKTDIGTIPTTHFDQFKQFYKSAFPAIITDKFDVGKAAVEAHIDIQSMHTLDNENVYYYKDGKYATITGTTPDTSNNPKIEFTGSRCKVFYNLSTSGLTSSFSSSNLSNAVANLANASNGKFNDSAVARITVGNAVTGTVNYAIEPVSKLGEFVSAKALAKFGTVSGDFSGLSTVKIANQAYSDPDTDEELEATFSFSSDEQSSWDVIGNVAVTVFSNSGTKFVEIAELGAVIEFDIDSIETHTYTELFEEVVTTSHSVENQWGEREVEYINETVTKTRTKTANTPADVEYVYASGKGRKYGSWVDADSRNNGFNENDLLENPIYIIEDILRTELSLSSSDIDFAKFDTAGNTTNGHIADPFNDSVTDIKFAFSQPKFINSRDLINRICKQAFSYFYFGGDGKARIRTLMRPTDSFSRDVSINFDDINFKSVYKTKLNTVRNDITINYNFDYGTDQNLSEVNTSDSTSKGTTVDGNNQTLKYNVDAENIIDDTTATKMANGYKAILKDRKIKIDFDILTPKHNDLEITDHFSFTNFDESIKLYGTAYSNDIFMITSISKKPEGCSIKAIKVDD
jgi:hypothetical protein